MIGSQKKIIFFVCLSIFLLLVPIFAGKYLTYLVNLSGIYAIAIMGLNILMGLGGQMFFGGVAMMAIGAYSVASLSIHAGIPFLISIVVGGFLTGLISLSIILPALRLRGLYLAMISVGFHLIIEQVIGGWKSLTGGYDGMCLPKASLFGFELSGDMAFYYIVLLAVLLSLYGTRNLMKMRVGRAIWSLGQDPVAASVIGLNVGFYKIVAFLICAFYCGVSGGLLACYLRFITPDHFTMNLAIMLLVGMIIGGWGSLGGSIAGGFFVTFLPEVIGLAKDAFIGASTALYDLESAISGIIIIVVVIFIPKGFAEWVMDLKVKWRHARRGES